MKKKMIVAAIAIWAVATAARPADADDPPNGTWAMRLVLSRGTVSGALPPNRSAMISTHSPTCRVGIFHDGKLLYLLPAGYVNGFALGAGESVGNHPSAAGDCVMSVVVFQYASGQDQMKAMQPFMKTVPLK